MRSTFLKRGILALAVVAATVFAVGAGAKGADAQVPSVNTNGPYTGTAGVAFQFTATTNVGPVATAQWSFSDGTTIAGLSVSKVLRTAGVYTATVTVTNTTGQTFQASTTATATPLIPYPGLTPVVFPGQIVTPVYQPLVYPIVGPCVFGRMLINGVYYC